MFGFFEKKPNVDRNLLFVGVLDATADKLEDYYRHGISGAPPVQTYQKTEIVVFALILVQAAIRS